MDDLDERRIGRIKVYYSCLKQFWDIIDDFIVLDVSIDEYKTITYTGLHPLFKKLKEGEVIPEYVAINDFDKKKLEYTYKIELVR